MTTRAEHLAWCKERALEYVAAGDEEGAVASMTSDLGKWDGGEMYAPETFALLTVGGYLHCHSPAQVKHWIEGFG
jgi:hypothetical protein